MIKTLAFFMRFGMILMVSLGWVMFIDITGVAQELEYTEHTGEEENLLKIDITPLPSGKEIVFTSSSIYAQHVILSDSGTQSWVHEDEKDQHNFRARREGDQIHINGIFKGAPIQKTVIIDEKQWYNKLDHGLSAWVKTEQEELVFWTLKLSSDLDPIEFHAEKIAEEEIVLPGGTFNTVKVKLSLDGLILSKLWSAYCWYDINSGIFLKFEGTNGGPGTPLTTIELSKVIVP